MIIFQPVLNILEGTITINFCSYCRSSIYFFMKSRPFSLFQGNLKFQPEMSLFFSLLETYLLALVSFEQTEKHHFSKNLLSSRKFISLTILVFIGVNWIWRFLAREKEFQDCSVWLHFVEYLSICYMMRLFHHTLSYFQSTIFWCFSMLVTSPLAFQAMTWFPRRSFIKWWKSTTLTIKRQRWGGHSFDLCLDGREYRQSRLTEIYQEIILIESFWFWRLSPSMLLSVSMYDNIVTFGV